MEPANTPPSGTHPAGATLMVVVGDGTRRIVGRVPDRGADLALVDLLARTALLARRAGGRLAVRGASAQLRGLLDLAGLAELLADQERGEAEVGKALGVDEVVQAGDRPV